MFSELVNKLQFHSCYESDTHSKSLQLLGKKLASLEKTASEDFFKSIEKLHLKKNTFLIKEGEVPRNLYFLINGMARVYSIEKDEEHTSDFFFPHEFVAMYDCSMLEIPSGYNVQLLTDAEVYKINWSKLKSLTPKYPILAEIEKIIVCCNLHNYKNRIKQLQLFSATDRYLFLLEQHPDILKTASLAHIASYLGVSQERLSRIRKKLG